MHELLDVRPWPRALLRYPLLILTALLLGALLAFSYSYAPLHRAKDWQIDYLETRLERRNDQLQELEGSLAEAQASLSETLSSTEITAIRTRLKEATRLADSREKEIASLEKKLTRTTKSRDQWRSRHAAVLAENQTQQAETPLPTREPSDQPPAAAGADGAAARLEAPSADASRGD